jgi:hypothetical protein
MSVMTNFIDNSNNFDSSEENNENKLGKLQNILPINLQYLGIVQNENFQLSFNKGMDDEFLEIDSSKIDDLKNEINALKDISDKNIKITLNDLILNCKIISIEENSDWINNFDMNLYSMNQDISVIGYNIILEIIDLNELGEDALNNLLDEINSIESLTYLNFNILEII